MSEHPTTCCFEHPGFAVLQSPLFRLTEGDRVPAMAIDLDGSQAMISLRAVAKLFGIEPESRDGRLLGLVAEALRFVACIRIGDALPAEVVSGDASWEPSAYHRQIASARLQMQLVSWIGGTQDGEGRPITPEMLVASADDPAIRQRVNDALRRAADELDIQGGGPAVAALVEELAMELAYIEALRERLLVRVRTVQQQVAQLGKGAVQLSASRRETLFQVTRLMGVGATEIADRFDQVDAQTGEILSALRNLEHQRSFLRPNRDWLYCSQLAWDAELQEWLAVGPNETGERMWKLVDRMYRFVARRHMAVQEWQSMNAASTEKAKSVLVW